MIDTLFDSPIGPFIGPALWGANALVFTYFVVLNASYLTLSVIAFRAVKRYAERLRSLDVKETIAHAGAPPITLIAPAYNEEATVVESVRSLLSLNYPEYEVIVVNDGSGDATVERMIEAFDLRPSPKMSTFDVDTAEVRRTYRSRRHPHLWLVDKENGGKADALNAGLCYCRTPLFCAMDADTLLERDALIRVVRPFLEDARTVAAGGIIRIANGCTIEGGAVTDIRLPDSLVARLQVLEYLRAFLVGRMGWDTVKGNLIISGAFGIFRRSTVIAAGGFSTKTVGEDMELVVRLHRYCLDHEIPYRVSFVPDPVAWTEAPESLRILGRQRDRWQRGLSESLTMHRKMLLRTKYGRIGMAVMPHFYFLEMWGPLVEVMGYVVFLLTVLAGWASPAYVSAFLMVTIVLGIALSVAALALEELAFRRYPRPTDLLRLFVLAVTENVGYRQITAFWRLRGLVRFLRKTKGWGVMPRAGFGGGKTRAAATETAGSEASEEG
ncbi:MAG: glycosyltransferase [Gemmatimonadota bacterium]|nr:glycosyltransferase [Gemmatimonadota bacterium]